MKISNYRLAKSIACFSIFAILSLSILLFLSKNIILNTICFALSLLFVYILFRIECVMYENSGNCITFRKCHPLSAKKFIPPFVELPQSSIKDFNLTKKGLGITKLTLKIHSNRNKKTVVKMMLFGFSKSQNKKIDSSLELIKLKNIADFQS